MLVFQYLSLIIIVYFLPYQISVLLRSIVNDRPYGYSYMDMIIATSISYLLYTGLPELELVNQIKSIL